MSSRTSSRSTLTIVPSTMSPSLKYLMVRSMAARKSSADPMSLIATCGAVAVGVDMWWGTPECGVIGTWSGSRLRARTHSTAVGARRGRVHPGDLNDALGRRCFRYATPAGRRPDECGLLHSETAQTHSARFSLRHFHPIE